MLVIRYDVTDNTAKDYDPETMTRANTWMFILDDSEAVIWRGDFLHSLDAGNRSEYPPHKVWFSLTPDQSDRLIAYTAIKSVRFIDKDVI